MKLIVILVLALSLYSCASKPPEIIQTIPEDDITLSEVKSDFSTFKGTEVRWGGRVVKVTDLEGGEFELEVLDYPLSDRGKPDFDGVSGSRFLTRLSSNGKNFYRNEYVTVVGALSELREVTLKNGETRKLPLLEAEEFHKWPTPAEERSNEPRFSIGIGVLLN